MPKLRYRGPATPPITVPAADATSDADGVIEVSDDVAKSLLAQDIWEPIGSKITKKEND